MLFIYIYNNQAFSKNSLRILQQDELTTEKETLV